MNEQSGSLDKLPRGWVWAQLDAIHLNISNSINPIKNPQGVYELYSVPSFDLKKPEIIKGQEIGSNKITVEENTILLCKINPRINRVWVVKNYSAYPKIASTEWIPFFELTGVNPEYLCYFMQNSNFREFVSTHVSGVGGSLMRINSSVISRFPIPIPPFPEQHRIVAKIEELFTRLDAGVAALKRIKVALQRYRQSVLKYALEGKLTEEWREANKDKIEPASVLMERIRKERKKEAKGKFKELPPMDTSGLPELPEGWVWATLDEVFGEDGIFIDGDWIESKDQNPEGEVRLIQLADIGDGNFRDRSNRFLSLQKAIELNCTFLSEGDVLIARMPDPLGRACIFPLKGERKFVTAVDVAIVRTGSNGIHNKYLMNVVNAIHIRSIIEQFQTGTTRKRISRSNLAKISMPIAPLAEQHRIVEKIERRLSVTDEVEKVIERNLKQADRLRQSILKKAFEGKLVPQDPTDEPAEKLLERIKAEKTKKIEEVKVKKSQKASKPRRRRLI